MSKSTQANGKGTVTLGQLIEDATVGDCENSMIMQICDIINSSDDGPREAVKSIRKGFATKSPSVIKQTLVLLETCVKNCGMPFCIQIASREFLDDFLKIIKAKYNHSRELQMTVLGLLQSWALAFQNVPELKEVNKSYQELKNKNVEFPPIDPNNLIELTNPVKVTTDSSGARDLLLPEGGQMYSHILSPAGAGPQTERRRSSGALRSGLTPTGMASQQVRRPSAATVQSYMLATGTVFQNSRRPSNESIQSIRRISADMIHHSCLSPTGTDSEKTRRRPSADLFHQPCLAPGGTDNEKYRRHSKDIVHNSSLSPVGLDSEKARRRPSTDYVQLPCLSPTGTDSDQTRRRLSVESQSRRASMESLYRRASIESQYRRFSAQNQNQRLSAEIQNQRLSAEIQNRRPSAENQYRRLSAENQHRRPSTEKQSASRSSEGHPVSSCSSAQSGVEEPVTAVGIKCHPEQVAHVSTAAKADSVVDNLVDLGGTPSSGTGASSQPPVTITKQHVDISLDGSNVKDNDTCNPCIVVTTIDEEITFDREQDMAEVEQWVMQN